MEPTERLFDVCSSGFMWSQFLIPELGILGVSLLLAYPNPRAPKGIRRQDVPIFFGVGSLLLAVFVLFEWRSQRTSCTALLEGEFTVLEGVVARRHREGSAIRVELADEVLEVPRWPGPACYYDGAVRPDPLMLGARVRVSYQTVDSRALILAIDRLEDTGGASSDVPPLRP